MVNKRGFLRTLEAIIAVLMIFGFMLVVFPKEKTDLVATPHEITLLQDVLMEKIQQSSELRNAILQCQDEDTGKNTNDLINGLFISALPQTTTYTYAFKVSDSESKEGCTFNSNGEELIEKEFEKEKAKKTAGKQVYTQSVFVSVEDVSETNVGVTGTNKIVTIYLWSQE